MKSNSEFTPCRPLPEPKGASWWQWVVAVALSISAFIPWSVVTWNLGPWAGAY